MRRFRVRGRVRVRVRSMFYGYIGALIYGAVIQNVGLCVCGGTD